MKVSDIRLAGPWKCFHCGETFFRRDAAACHFGESDGATPACRLAPDLAGLVALLREQAAELGRFRREETASFREFHALGSAHATALRRAEETGYEKALRDLEDGRVERDLAVRLMAALAPVAGRA